MNEPEWKAVKRPHNATNVALYYDDDTKFRWAVEYQTPNGTTVEIADWLTEDVAHLVAAAPELLGALKFASAIIGHPDDAGSKYIVSVITKAATGRYV